MKHKQFHIRKSQSLKKIIIEKSSSDTHILSSRLNNLHQIRQIQYPSQTQQKQKKYFSVLNQKRKKSLNQQNNLLSNKSNKLILVKKKNLSLFQNTVLHSQRQQKIQKFNQNKNTQQSLSQNRSLISKQQKIIISKKQLMNKLNDVKKCLDFTNINKREEIKTQANQKQQKLLKQIQKLPPVKQIFQREKMKSQCSNYYSTNDQINKINTHYLQRIKRNDTVKIIQQKMNLFAQNKTQNQIPDRANFKKDKIHTLKTELGDKVKDKILKKMNMNPFHTNQFPFLKQMKDQKISPINKTKNNILNSIDLSPIMKKQKQKNNQTQIPDPNLSFLSKNNQSQNNQVIKNDSFFSTIVNEQIITNLFPQYQHKKLTTSKQKKSKINMNKIKNKFPSDFFSQKSR